MAPFAANCGTIIPSFAGEKLKSPRKLLPYSHTATQICWPQNPRVYIFWSSIGCHYVHLIDWSLILLTLSTTRFLPSFSQHFNILKGFCLKITSTSCLQNTKDLDYILQSTTKKFTLPLFHLFYLSFCIFASPLWP